MIKAIFTRLGGVLLVLLIAKLCFLAGPGLIEYDDWVILVVSGLLLAHYLLLCNPPITSSALLRSVKIFGMGVLAGSFFSLLSHLYLIPYFLRANRLANILPALDFLRWPTLFAATLGGVLVEEVFLRGHIKEIFLMGKMPAWLSILLQGVFFAAIHTAFFSSNSFQGILFFFVCGGMLSAAALYYNGIAWPVGLHFTWNFVIAIFEKSHIIDPETTFHILRPVFFGVQYFYTIFSIFGILATLFFINQMKKANDLRND